MKKKKNMILFINKLLLVIVLLPGKTKSIDENYDIFI